MKISPALLLISIMISTSCGHDAVKKEKDPVFTGRPHGITGKTESKEKKNSDREKKEKRALPDIQFEELTVRKKKNTWRSPVDIDYDIYSKNAGVRLVIQNSHSDKIEDLAVSPDGKIIVTASLDKTIRIWSISGVLLRVMKFDSEWVNRVIITPDGRRIIGCMKNRMMVWRIDGELLNNFSGKEYNINDISVSGDGKRVVTCSKEGFFDIRNSSLKLIKRVKTGSRIARIAISPDGKFIAVGGSYQKTGSGWYSSSALWNGSGTFIRYLSSNRPEKGDRNSWRKEYIGGDMRWIIFSPDSRYIALVNERHLIDIRKISGELVNSIKFVFVQSCFFSHDSRELIAMGSHHVKIFDLSGREVFSVYMRSKEERGNVVSCFGMTPDGEQFVTGFSYPVSGLVRIWNRRGEMINSLGSRSKEYQRVLLAPDGNRIILEPDRRKSVSFVWDLKKNSIDEIDERIGFYRDGGEYRYYYGRYNIFHISGSRGSGRFKTAYGTGVIPLADGKIARWNPMSGKFSFSKGTVVLHDYRENPIKRIQYRHYATSGIGGPFPYGTEFSPDGQYFIIESSTYHGGIHYISLIDMKGKVIRRINVETDLSTAAIRGDGNIIATGHENGLIQVWSRMGKRLIKMKGSSVEVSSLFFGGKGRFLVSASKDRIIRLWNIRNGRRVSIQVFGNRGWILYDDRMKYDTSDAGGKHLSFIRGLTLVERISAEKKYKSPGLLKSFYR